MLEKHRMDHAEWLANLAIKKALNLVCFIFKELGYYGKRRKKNWPFEDAHKALSLDDRILAAHQF